MKKIIIVIITLGVLGLGWYLLSPLFLDTIVNEDFPIEIEKENSLEVSMGQDIIMDESMLEVRSEMSVTKIGSFIGADNSHQGSGDVKLIIDGEKKFLRFENFSVTNGPDLFVTVNKQANPTSDNFGEHIIIGALKGNKGSQNYDISDIDISEYASVSIYCRAFSTLFATAKIQNT